MAVMQIDIPWEMLSSKIRMEFEADFVIMRIVLSAINGQSNQAEFVESPDVMELRLVDSDNAIQVRLDEFIA